MLDIPSDFLSQRNIDDTNPVQHPDSISLAKRTKELLRNAGLRPRKRLGQNFLVNEGVLQAIIEALEPSSEDVVLEIGAGTGTLTRQLALSSGKVIAVELDDGLFRILQFLLRNSSNIALIHADILDLDLSRLVAEYANRHSRIKFVGNLPYYITTPILMRILDESPLVPIHMALVMVQEEVGMRMVASPGTKDYGAFSVAVAYRSDAEVLRRVPASSFYPKPKVDSILVRLNMRAAPPVDVKNEQLFFRIVRAAFQHRRKTLRNALLLACRSGEIQGRSPQRAGSLVLLASSEPDFPTQSRLSMGLSAEYVIDSALCALGLDTRRRGETLSIEEFAALANMIQSLLNAHYTDRTTKD